MTPEGDNATPTQPPLKRPPTGLGAQSSPASAGAGSARVNAGDPWFLRREVILVLALSLGASGVSAFISFVGSLTAPKSLSHQTASLISDAAPGREWLGLAWEVFGLATDLVPVALVAYLLAVRGGSLRTTIGFSRPNRLDLLRGAGIAAVIGGAGLVFYLGSRAAGVNLTVVPSTLPGVWWRFPALIQTSAIKDERAGRDRRSSGTFTTPSTSSAGGRGAPTPRAPWCAAATTCTRGWAASPATPSWA